MGTTQSSTAVPAHQQVRKGSPSTQRHYAAVHPQDQLGPAGISAAGQHDAGSNAHHHPSPRRGGLRKYGTLGIILVCLGTAVASLGMTIMHGDGSARALVGRIKYNVAAYTSRASDEPHRRGRSLDRVAVELEEAGAGPALDTDGVTAAFEGVIDGYLQPWLPMPEMPERVVSTDMFDYMERRFYGMGIRVRIFQGRVLFRNVYAYQQPYYYARMRFHLSAILDAVQRFHIDDTELFLGLGDGPRAAIDTSAPIQGLPIFSHVTSDAHIDIGIPEAFEYGAYGTYSTDAIPSTPWDQKEARLFFRGASTNFDMAAHNWHTSPRVRAAKLSAARADDDTLDLGISRWSHVRSSNTDPSNEWRLATAQDVERDAGVTLAPKTALEDQCLAKWLLNLDGALGSARRAAILRCGSVLVQQDSPWHAFYSPLLVEGEHFVRVDRHLRNLTAVVEWLTAHDDEARQIAANGKRFAEAFLTRDAAVEYWGLLLQRWVTLFADGQRFEPVDMEWDHCAEPDVKNNPLKSVMNCSKGWQEFTSLEAYDTMYEGH